MSNIRVDPKPYIITKMVGSVQISIINIDFGLSATFNVILFDENGSLIVCNQVTLAGADYEAWGNDDQYVINYILNMYGLVPAS
jgi:hypothetical protein